MNQFKIEQFGDIAEIAYNDGLLVAEATELAPNLDIAALTGRGEMLKIEFEGGVKRFRHAKTDRSGGDVAGWRFVEANSHNPMEVLIIND